MDVSVSGFAYDMNMTKNTGANRHPYKIIFCTIAGVYVFNILKEFLNLGFVLTYGATLYSSGY